MVCLGGLGLANAQEITARLDFSKRDPLPSIFEYISADQGLVTLGQSTRKSSRYLNITKYDAGFKEEWTQQVLAQNGRNSIDQMAILGEGIYIFYSEYFPRTRSIRQFYSIYDLDGGVVMDKAPIAELPNEKELRVDLKYTRSLNKKKLLCYKNLNNVSKAEKIIYYLFDSEEEGFVEGTIELPYPDEKFQVKRVIVSNTGFVYVVGKLFKVNRVTSPDDFEYQVYRYVPGASEGDHFTVQIESGLYITDLQVRVDRNEYIYIAGFFSERGGNAIGGTIYQRINPDFQVEAEGIQNFPEDLMGRFLSDRQMERGKELRYFYLDNIILRTDGGVLLIAEKYYTTVNTFLDTYGMWVDQKVYHYDDIIVNSVSAQGELEWSAAVPKRQQSENPESLSYLDVVAGAELFLLYGSQPRKAPSTIYFNAISMEGQVANKEMLLGGGADSDTFFPRSSEQISNTEALIFIYQDREKIYSIAKVDFGQ
jgi:hypothetical protein